MKNNYLFILCLTIVVLGCDTNVEPITNTLNPPKSISIKSGNNQIGYSYEYLSDSIVIEIIPESINDLDKYWYYVTSKDDYVDAYSTGTVINDKLYISIKWKLSAYGALQELIFHLDQKCSNDNSICHKIDSLTISAAVKTPWEETFSGAVGTLFDIHFADDNNGILVGDLPFGSGYFKTMNGGKTWNATVNDRNDLYQLSFSDSKIGIVIVTNNWAYFTDNGGQSFYEGDWTPPIVGHRSSSDYFMFNSKQIISIGRNATIAKTIDSGKTWSTYKRFTFKNDFYDITCTDINTCYACGAIGKVVKSTDAGETWKEQEILLNNYLKKIYFLDNEFGFAAGQFGALVRTIDGGNNWDIMASGLKFTIIEIYFYNSKLGYIVSTAGEIGKTMDGGVTWELLNKDNYGVYELNKAFFKGNDILGLQGGSIYKYELNNE